jgi:RimJ/RimL family protein N-acetyltransferase
VLRKLGFEHDGMVDYKQFRVAHFVITAEQWRARR